MQKLHKVTNRVYYLDSCHETDRPVLGAIVGDNYTLLVDAGNSPVHAMLMMEELEKQNVNKPAFVALTHWHWDHIFGLSKLNIPAIAHVKTAKYMKEMQSYSWSDEAIDERVSKGIEVPFCADMIKKEFGDNREEIKIVPPTITFDDYLILDLGGITCTIQHVGGDHADDSCIVHVVEEKFVFLGDCTAYAIYSDTPYIKGENVIPLYEKLLALDADQYLFGHEDAPSTRESIMNEDRENKGIANLVSLHGENVEAIFKGAEEIVGMSWSHLKGSLYKALLTEPKNKEAL